MQFRVVPAVGVDASTPPQFLQLPAITPLPAETVTRQVAMIEKAGVGFDAADEPVEGPVEALLGTVADGVWTERMWADPVTENPAVGATEVWEMYNTTADAHPMHIHEITFEVVNRQGLVTTGEEGEVVQPIQLDGNITPPEPWENGFKDTVDRLPQPGHPGKSAVRHTRPVRLALPHRRARGQRDDAALPDWSGAAGSTARLGENDEEQQRGHFLLRPEYVAQGAGAARDSPSADASKWVRYTASLREKRAPVRNRRFPCKAAISRSTKSERCRLALPYQRDA